MNTAYVNGTYLPLEQAMVPAMDRGFLFSDGVYEVIPVYNGKPFCLEEHLARLTNSLKAIQLESAIDLTVWRQLSEELIQRNGGGNQYIYLQITRGPAPKRDFDFPEIIKPTVFAYTQPYTFPTLEILKEGVSAITLADIRWDLCHIKSLSLLGSVLQRHKAAEAGVEEGILINQGNVIEGTASNIFIVKQDTILTPPKSEHMLPGITRGVVLEIAEQQKISYREEIIPEADLYTADEIWITSSLDEVMPVLKLNNQIVGEGQPGRIWEKMIAYYKNETV